ncbi:MAG: DUF4160 domain-containing protein [Verrucomicrobiae bacterium]|nr:DUF4160 domain-containing protein [Verrucomicrobiae bacterium]
MPTTVIGDYKFRFYSSDAVEPPHMHVIRGGKVAKIWLEPIAVEYNRGYNQAELNRIVRLAEANREKLLIKWYEYFGLYGEGKSGVARGKRRALCKGDVVH